MSPSKKVCQVQRGKQLVVDVVAPARSKLFSPPLYHVGVLSVHRFSRISTGNVAPAFASESSIASGVGEMKAWA